jgi:threonine/homoserine/homoserine lactone efflux protein
VISGADAGGIALVAVGLALTPGPNLLYLVSRSLSQGTRAGLISLAGIGAGFVIWLAAAVVGLAAVLAAVPAASTAVRIAGATYLLWLAWQNLRRRPAGFDARALAPDRSAAVCRRAAHQPAQPEDRPAVPVAAPAVRRPGQRVGPRAERAARSRPDRRR